MTPRPTRPTTPRSMAVAAMLFGVLTLLSGGRALFGGVDMGHVVPFVLWFNFLAGFAYVAAGWGLWRGLGWAVPLSAVIAAATALIFLAFLVHVGRGGAYEPRTMAALALRTGFWTVVSLLLYRRRR